LIVREDAQGNPIFVATPTFEKKSADRLLARIVAQVLKLLRRRGIINAEQWLVHRSRGPTRSHAPALADHLFHSSTSQGPSLATNTNKRWSASAAPSTFP